MQLADAMRTTLLALLMFVSTSLSAADGECRCPLPNDNCVAATEAPAPDLSKIAAARLTGVFVVFDEGISNWDTALRMLACAGIKTVIIQSVKFDRAQAQTLLRAAGRQRDVKVYVGLHYDGGFSAGTSSLTDALLADQVLADEVARWSADVRAGISGWYIANEIHNFQIWNEHLDETERLAWTFERADEVRCYLQATISYLKSKAGVPGKDILISPQFNPTQDGALLPAGKTRELFRRMFMNSGVTVVLLQDGFGARNEPERIGCCRWTPARFETQSFAYQRAVRDGLAGTGTRFGVNVESFTFDENLCTTTSVKPDRFQRQRQIVPKDAAMVVTFSLRTLRTLWASYTKSIGATCAAP